METMVDAELIRSLYEDSPVGIVVLSETNIIIQANAAAHQILGLQGQTRLSGPATDLMALLDIHVLRPGTYKRNICLRSGHCPLNIIVYKTETLPGTIVQLLHDPDGALSLIPAHGNEEEKLRESEERLRLALSASNQGIYDYTIASGEVAVSEGYATMLGYEPGTFRETFECWLQRLHPADRDSASEYLRRYLAGEVSDYKVEFRLRGSDGNWRWISSVGRVVNRDDRGTPLRMLGTHTDITETKVAEESLRQKNRELNEIIDALDESSLVSLTDTRGKILKVNKRFCKIAGYSEAELVGKDHRIINSGHHSKEFWSNFWATLKRGEIWHGEIKNRAKNGAYYWVSTVINPIRDELGVVRSYLSIRQDITDRKKYETLLLDSNFRLAKIEQFVNLTMDAISVSNEQGSLIFINKVAAEQFGIPQDQSASYYIFDIEEFFDGRPEKWREYVESLKCQKTLFTEGNIINQQSHRRTPVEVTLRYVEILDAGYIISIIRDVTERRRSEHALRQSEARLAEAQRLARLGYWELHLGSGGMWWSPEQYEMCGYNNEFTPTKDTFLNQVHHQDRDNIKRMLSRLEATGASASVVYRIVRPDGTERIIQGKASLVRDEAGRPVKISGINQDITELALSEKALKESEHTLKRAQRVAKIGSWKLDLSSDLLQWSEEVYHIFERPVGKALTSKMFYSFVHPDDREYVNRMWLRALEGEPYDIVHRIIVKNKIKWVREQAELTVNAKNNLVFGFGTVQDITDLQILKETNHIFNQSQLLTGIGSWRLSLKDNDFFWSDNVFLLHGLDPQYVRPSIDGLLETLHSEDRQKLQQVLAPAAGMNGQFSIEYRVLKQGSHVWLSNYGNVVADTLGNVIEIYGIVRDINIEKTRTDELVKARQDAIEANLVKDEFLSVMSHEIRTPLNSVIGLSNLLLRRTPREDQLEILKTLKGSADNLLHLVNDILDFNKIRAGKLQLEIIPFSLTEFLRQLYTSFRVVAQDKGLEFSIQSDARIPEMLAGDVTRLNQILINLISNAIKFTFKGFVRLRVDLLSESGSDYTITFSVEDSGVGIAPDKLSLIFQPFQQSERDISRKFGGTGLGLSIVSSLAEIMSGRINVESTPRKGSRFIVELPFRGAPDTGKPDRRSRSRVTDKAAASAIPISVLYVEDVESNRFLITNLLHDHGIRCTCVTSGNAALKVTRHERFDLILMDLQMPGMDGYETTRRIRSQRCCNMATTVIAFTAEPFSAELRSRVRQHTIIDVITKPYDNDQLIDKIRSYGHQTRTSSVSFDFYKDAFGHDPIRLDQIRKSVQRDLYGFEKSFSRGWETKDFNAIRAATHRIRPIIKLLQCDTILRLLDKTEPPTASEESAEMLKMHVQLLRKQLRQLRH